VDPNLRLVRPEAVSTMDGVAFAWTTRGVVAVNEGGVRETISAGKVDTILRPFQEQLADDNTTTGAFVTCWQEQRLVIVAVPNSAAVGTDTNITVSQYALVWSAVTSQWSKIPGQYWSAIAPSDIGKGPFLISTRPDGAPYFEIRRWSSSRVGADATFTVVLGYPGGFEVTVTDANRGDWYPRVGDWLVSDTDYARVLKVDYFAPTWTLTVDQTLKNNATAVAYEGTPVLLEWMPAVTKTQAPFTLPTFREASVSFSNGPATTISDVQDARITVGARHDFSDTAATVVATPDRATVNMRPYRVGWPRNAALRAVLWPRVLFSEILWDWAITGISLVGTGGTEKVRR
jgi:hypothetical protein